MTDKETPMAAILFFKMSPKYSQSRFFNDEHILPFEIYTYNTLCSRGPTKVLALSRINVPGGHHVFQNEAKNIPRQHFMVINIPCQT